MASRTHQRRPRLQAKPRTNVGTISDGKQPTLLILPPEIRNEIYMYTAHSTSSITLHDFDSNGCKITPPPLSQVCKQLRQEYLPLWKHEASKQARDVDIHIRNFNFKDVEMALTSLTRQSPKVKRQYHVKIRLDDTFTSRANTNHFFNLLHGRLRRVLVRQGPVESIGFWIDFDPENFDADRAKKWFQKEVRDEWRDEREFLNAREFGHLMAMRALKRAFRREDGRAAKENWREAVLRRSVELKFTL